MRRNSWPTKLLHPENQRQRHWKLTSSRVWEKTWRYELVRLSLFYCHYLGANLQFFCKNKSSRAVALHERFQLFSPTNFLGSFDSHSPGQATHCKSQLIHRHSFPRHYYKPRAEKHAACESRYDQSGCVLESNLDGSRGDKIALF